MATEKRLIDANVLGSDTFHVMCEGEYGEPCERCVVDWDDIETAPTVDAVEVCYCDNCVNHGNCLTEDIFRMARIEKPYCCVGKVDGDGNG